MNKILVVAEKPSVGRDIARVLGCKTKGEGCLIGESYIVSWAIGHLVTLCDPEEYEQKYKKWNFDTLPIMPDEMKLKPIKKTAAQLKILKKLMNDKEIDSIVCATDSGREGELIFRYIYTVVKCKKSVKRLWISSMTDQAILEGFKNLKSSKEYDFLYFSAKCRSEADWLVGMNATRAYTLKYKALLSIGRVQTPTLAIMVKRQNEINEFVSEDYYEVHNQYGDFSGIWFLPENKSFKIKEKEKAEEIKNKVLKKQGYVESIQKTQKKQPPPLLYDLTELQRDCNKRYGFSAQKTLSLAQDLYEKRKMITYPRTDSRYLSDDMIGKIQSVLKKLSCVMQYKEYGETILNLFKLPLSKRMIDNTKISDHHAIIPTDGTIHIERMTEDEKKVYHLIVLRFLAGFYTNYVYDVTNVITNVENEKFLSKGMAVVEYGWMALYKELKEPSKKEDKTQQQIPVLKEKETVFVQDCRVLKKKTMPPPQYTESTLLSAMENAGRFVEEESLKEQLKESGLGTPATRAAIIERLITVGYIMRKGKNLEPTTKGMQIISVVPEQLKSPETTGKWEKGLCSISKGKMAEERFMESIKRYVKFLIQEAEKTNETIVFEPEENRYKTKSKISSLGKCPLCAQGAIYENSKSYYCSKWKEGCKFTMWKNSLDAYGCQFSPSLAKKLLKNNMAADLKITLPQTGEKCSANLVLKEDNSGKVELRDVTRL